MVIDKGRRLGRRTIEVDVLVQAETTGDPAYRFEMKLFTCPARSGTVLARLMRPAVLEAYFTTRHFMGFVTFASIHDARRPGRPPCYNNEVPERLRTGWFLHLVLVDNHILETTRTATAMARGLLDAMREDHAFLAGKLSLNTRACSISVITNYVKVIKMSYVIEQLKQELKEERRHHEQERRLRGRSAGYGRMQNDGVMRRSRTRTGS